jgi:hypothetical protein
MRRTRGARWWRATRLDDAVKHVLKAKNVSLCR